METKSFRFYGTPEQFADAFLNAKSMALTDVRIGFIRPNANRIVDETGMSISFSATPYSGGIDTRIDVKGENLDSWERFKKHLASLRWTVLEWR